MGSILLNTALVVVAAAAYLGAIRLISGTDKDSFKGTFIATTPFFVTLIIAMLLR